MQGCQIKVLFKKLGQKMFHHFYLPLMKSLHYHTCCFLIADREIMDVLVHDSLEIQVKLSTREFFSGHGVLVVDQVSQVPVTVSSQ